MTINELSDILDKIKTNGYGDADVGVQWGDEDPWETPIVLDADFILHIDGGICENSKLILRAEE